MTAATKVELTAGQALALRMRSLLLHRDDELERRSDVADVAGVVRWFGAMQAQDAASAHWSLGVRLPGWKADDVQAALERREALRTWPMRGTVHLVPPRDARWMLDVLGSHALAKAAARRSHLGLDGGTADRAVEVLGAALAGGRRLTRAQCLATLAGAGIDTGGQRGYHLLWYASQLGVTCIAPNAGTEQTFALLDEWAPDPHRPDREQALGTIATRYFRSHGPTTRQDFAGWTGLPAADAKLGIAAAGDALATVRVDGRDMLLDPSLLDAVPSAKPAREPVSGPRSKPDTREFLALPGFDEYLLGYKDRTLMLAAEHKQAIIPGGNGVFQPTIVRDGKVIGTWRRTVARNRTVVAVRPLVTVPRSQRAGVERALEPYGTFTGRPLEVRWS